MITKTPPNNISFYRQGINVDGSGTCLLKCPKCFRETTDIKQLKLHNITPENFRKLCKAFSDINLCGTYSDPIYNPRFHEILQVCVDENTNVEVHTNGHGKNLQWWKKTFEISKLMRGKIKWIFALDGLPKDSHIYRIGQDGEAVWEIMKYGASMELDITWQYIIFKYNENDIEEAKQMCLDHKMNFLVLKSSKWGEHYGISENNDEYLPSKDNYIKNLRVVDYKSVDKIYPRCLTGAMTPSYLADGRILPCCMMIYSKTVLDNIMVDDVEDIRFEILMCDEWNDFYDTLINDPKNAPDICKKFCGQQWNHKEKRIYTSDTNI